MAVVAAMSLCGNACAEKLQYGDREVGGGGYPRHLPAMTPGRHLASSGLAIPAFSVWKPIAGAMKVPRYPC